MNPEQEEQYNKGRTNYHILELEKWQDTIKSPCLARRIGITGMEVCGINYGECLFNNCFAAQIIKHSKGFL